MRWLVYVVLVALGCVLYIYNFTTHTLQFPILDDGVLTDDVTMTVMSCNRFDLLNRTIHSLGHVKVRDKIIMIDCYNDTFHERVEQHFPEFTILLSRSRSNVPELRLMSNFDHLFEYVHTTYWFHVEDDWEFYREANYFIEKSKYVLKNDPRIFQVIAINKKHVDTTFTHVGDMKYNAMKILSGPGGVFGSFSANPFVMRTRDKERFIGKFTHYRSEAMISKTLGKIFPENRLAVFPDGFTKHIGGDQSKVHKKALGWINPTKWELERFVSKESECHDGLHAIGENVIHGCCQTSTLDIEIKLRARHFSNTALTTHHNPATSLVHTKFVNKSVLFAGDSTTQGMVNSLVYQLVEEGQSHVSRVDSMAFQLKSTGFFKPIKTCKHVFKKPSGAYCDGEPCENCNEVHRWYVNETNTTIAFYSFYTLYDSKVSKDWPESLMFRRGSMKLMQHLVETHDVHVVNIGLHESSVTSFEYYAKIKHIGEMLTGKTESFYRLSFPQHFQGGHYEIGKKFVRKSVPRHWSDIYATAILADMNVNILDFYDVMSTAWFMHTRDPTHFCYSPNLWGPIWNIFQNTIK